MLRLVLFLLAPALLPAQAPGDWPLYGRDAGGQRHSPLRQITPANVGKLKAAWTIHTGGSASEATPLAIGGILYIASPTGILAVAPETGAVLWKYEMQGASRRGLAYWPGDRQAHARVYSGASDGRMVAIDIETGKPAPGFGKEGFVDLRQGVADEVPNARFALASPPAVFKDIVITGGNNNEPGPAVGAYGDIRGWDARTGKLLWTFHTVPRPGEAGHETWRGMDWKNRSGTNAWGLMTVDVARGMVFVPIGSPTADFYGADRVGDGLYGNSLVALDAATGKVKWAHQLVHHDLWDYDLAAAPALIDINPLGADGRRRARRAVAQITKMGMLFLFDEMTGEPIFGMEERPVAQSVVPGEATSRTQPFPLKPAPLSRVSMSKDDLYNKSPEHAAYCRKLWEDNEMSTQGPFTPWPLAGNAITFPSTLGGGNWSGVTFDPSLGYIVTNVMNLGQWGHMEQRGDTYVRNNAFGLPHARFWNPDSKIPCQNPPFGELVAVNANTGEIAWKVPLGRTEELEKLGVKDTGALNLGGSISTASGLVFIAATADGRMRAFETRTGKELWWAQLDVPAYSTPMTFEARNGKQYVVVVQGGGSYFQSPSGDSITAFALP